jgi:hypothetical protein
VDPLVVEQRWFAGSLWRPGVWIFVSGSWERFVLFFDVLDQNREKKIALLGNGDLVAVDTFPTPCPADDTVTSLERSRSFTGPPPAAASGDTPISQAFCSLCSENKGGLRPRPTTNSEETQSVVDAARPILMVRRMNFGFQDPHRGIGIHGMTSSRQSSRLWRGGKQGFRTVTWLPGIGSFLTVNGKLVVQLIASIPECRTRVKY